jgi:hypothetical protein
MTLIPALLLAAAVSGAVEIADRSEVRVRSQDALTGPAVDAETTPTVTVRVRARGWELTLGYLPRFTLRDAARAMDPETLHSGALTAAWHLKRLTLGARGDFSYGTQSYTSLVLDPGQISGAVSIERLPPSTTVGYVASSAGLTLRYAASRRWIARGRFEYALAGGVDASAREALPLQSGPRAEVGAEGALTRKDHLDSAVEISRTTFSSGPEHDVLELSEAWRHALGRTTETTLGGGAALISGRGTSGSATRAYAVAHAALAHGSPTRGLETRLSLRYAPVLDRLSGAVDPRLQASAAATLHLSHGTAAHGQLGLAQSIPALQDGAVTLVIGEAALSTRIDRAVLLELGTRCAVQRVRSIGATTPQWIAFVSTTFALPSVRF